MNPFEQQMQSLAALWGEGGKAYLAAQQSLLAGMGDAMAKAAAGGQAPPSLQPDLQGFEAARQDFSKLWSSATDLSAALAKTLQSPGQASPQAAEMLAKIFDPRGWFSATGEMDQTLQRLAEGPRLADLWNVERKVLAVFNAWTAMRRHSLTHNAVMLEAWMRAAGAFARTLNERAERGETLDSVRELLALWVETANEVLLETQRSEAFLATQRDLIKASADLRLAQQDLAELSGEMYGAPTRTELDDVHRAVTELRRELRALKRQGRQGRKAAPEPRQDGADPAQAPAQAGAAP